MSGYSINSLSNNVQYRQQYGLNASVPASLNRTSFGNSAEGDQAVLSSADIPKADTQKSGKPWKTIIGGSILTAYVVTSMIKGKWKIWKGEWWKSVQKNVQDKLLTKAKDSATSIKTSAETGLKKVEKDLQELNAKTSLTEAETKTKEKLEQAKAKIEKRLNAIDKKPEEFYADLVKKEEEKLAKIEEKLKGEGLTDEAKNSLEKQKSIVEARKQSYSDAAKATKTPEKAAETAEKTAEKVADSPEVAELKKLSNTKIRAKQTPLYNNIKEYDEKINASIPVLRDLRDKKARTSIVAEKEIYANQAKALEESMDKIREARKQASKELAELQSIIDGRKKPKGLMSKVKDCANKVKNVVKDIFAGNDRTSGKNIQKPQTAVEKATGGLEPQATGAEKAAGGLKPQTAVAKTTFRTPKLSLSNLKDQRASIVRQLTDLTSKYNKDFAAIDKTIEKYKSWKSSKALEQLIRERRESRVSQANKKIIELTSQRKQLTDTFKTDSNSLQNKIADLQKEITKREADKLRNAVSSSQYGAPRITDSNIGYHKRYNS